MMSDMNKIARAIEAAAWEAAKLVKLNENQFRVLSAEIKDTSKDYVKVSNLQQARQSSINTAQLLERIWKLESFLECARRNGDLTDITNENFQQEIEILAHAITNETIPKLQEKVAAHLHNAIFFSGQNMVINKGE